MPAPSILLADDDVPFRSIVRSVLEDDGYAIVAEAGTAREVVSMARRLRPDVVVLDLVMSGSVGLSTARALLAENPHRPVVVMSSLLDPVVEQEAVVIGAWYVEKVEGVEALEHQIDDAFAVAHRR